jgi:glutathione S-transferase
MNLLVSFDDYCVDKIQLTASIAKLNLNVKKGLTAEELVKLEPNAKSILLEVNSNYISQHNAILRFIAESSLSTQLLGSVPLDRAQIDQWLEFSWQELGKINNCSLFLILNIINSCFSSC